MNAISASAASCRLRYTWLPCLENFTAPASMSSHSERSATQLSAVRVYLPLTSFLNAPSAMYVSTPRADRYSIAAETDFSSEKSAILWRGNTLPSALFDCTIQHRKFTPAVEATVGKNMGWCSLL